MIKRRSIKSTRQTKQTGHNTHLDLAPPVACSDVQLASLLRHVDQCSLCSPVGLSVQSVDRLVGGHLNEHGITASVLCLQDTLTGCYSSAST